MREAPAGDSAGHLVTAACELARLLVHYRYLLPQVGGPAVAYQLSLAPVTGRALT
jgi:hypothetical protein